MFCVYGYTSNMHVLYAESSSCVYLHRIIKSKLKMPTKSHQANHSARSQSYFSLMVDPGSIVNICLNEGKYLCFPGTNNLCPEGSSKQVIDTPVSH